MVLFKEVSDIAEKIIEQYFKIASYKENEMNGVKNSVEFSVLVEKLKDFLLAEDLAYEKLIMNHDDVDIMTALLDCQFKENSFDEIIYTRINEKIERRVTNPSSITNDIVFGLKKEFGNSSFIESKVTKFIENALTETEFTNFGPEVELLRNYIVFLKDEALKNDDSFIRSALIKNIMLTVYRHVALEEELIKSNFEINDDWIRVGNTLGLNDEELTSYKTRLYEVSENQISQALDLIFECEWDLSPDYKIFAIIQKCNIRAVLYSLDGSVFEMLKETVIKMIKTIRDIDPIAAQIIESSFEESKGDKEKYPKLLLSKQQTEMEKISMKVYSLYQELIELEIKRHNGEDVDFDIEVVLSGLKLIKEEETQIYKQEIAKKLKSLKPYGTSFSLVFENVPLVVAGRMNKVTDSLVDSVFAKEMGITSDMQLNLQAPQYTELYKNILFFIDEAINETSSSARDYLIKMKYDYVFENFEIEDLALDSNFQISKDYLMFPKTFEDSPDYILGLNELIAIILDEELRKLLIEENVKSEELELLVQRTVVLVRGCLYTLGDDYENIISLLESIVLDLVVDQNYATASTLTRAINLSKQDRVTYPKLVFKNND